MKFGVVFVNAQVPEWEKAYLNYKLLKKLLSPFKIKNKMYVIGKLDEGQRDSYIQRNKGELKILYNNVEDSYLKLFYGNDEKTIRDGKFKLRQIIKHKDITQNDVFLFGLFLGFSLILVGWIIILFLRGTLDADDASKVSETGEGQNFEYIFPLFRGAALFIVAQWLISFNIYGWNKFHVNYKLIFKFNYHFSQITEILRRAAFFTVVFLIFFIWYILVQYKKSELLPLLDWIQPQYCPIVVWILLIIYIVCPFRGYFNFKGRRYMWRLLKKCFQSPFSQMEFRMAWMTDQLISLGGAFKDLEYTACYYMYDSTKHNKDIRDVDYVCPSSQRPTAYILSIIPLTLRALQCIRQCYQDGYFNGHTQSYNLGKYLISIFASTLSYAVKIAHQNESDSENQLFGAWLVLAIIATVYSYFWDLKFDWGFLQPGQKGLRKVLLYKSPYFYYIAIFNNLALRLVWVISISPDIIDNLQINKEIFTFFVYFFELMRRCQWNFFRVEKEQVNNYENFKASRTLELQAKVERKNLNKSINSEKQEKELKILNSVQGEDKDSAFAFEPITQLLNNLNDQKQYRQKLVDDTYEFFKTVLKRQEEGFEVNQIRQNLKDFKDQVSKEGKNTYLIYNEFDKYK